MAQIMNSDEMMKKFDQLYAKMAASTDVEDMKLFGKAMRKAVSVLAVQMPAMANEIIEELCAVNWHNYITDKEVEEIVNNMEPRPKWSIDQVNSGLTRLGLPLEESPYYNNNALYVTISMKYSDSAATIADVALKKPLNEVEGTEMLRVCYHLALDLLKDKDGKFSIRKYFDL